ncbi:MAG: alpha/beta hydrolase-fold protein [Candidatus Lernaella stagnicola]|nr:alpha/beta hydrolase-fold protein [Candidatus Lernaella stagnicola]
MDHDTDMQQAETTDEATESETAAPRKPRRKLVVIGCLVPAVVLVLLAVIIVVSVSRQRAGWRKQAAPNKGQPEWVPDGMRFVPWASPGISYDGPGTIVAYMQRGCREGEGMADPLGGVTATGKGIRCREGFPSRMVAGPRDMFIHLPAGYEETTDKLPLIVAFHGFGQRPGHAIYAFAKALDEAQQAGRLPATITVFPDSSLGGNGLDDLSTPWDENGGSWGVNSNVGRFADHFTQEIMPYLLETYRISDKPGDTVLLGGSMGGMMAINYMLDDPRRFPNVGAFYPGLDLRYSCGGDNRLADYSPDCYQPITKDRPNRKMTTHEGIRGRLFVERMFLHPVFDSDKLGGPVWTDEKAVWERVRDNNPVDRLRAEKPDLRGVHIWYLVGDKDDFNIDAQRFEFDKLVTAAGATLYPEAHVRPGRHDMPFFNKHLREAINWMNQRFQAK